MTTVRTEGQWERPRGQEEQRFEAPRFVKAGCAKILHEPHGTAIRLKKHPKIRQTDEVGGGARSLPVCGAPEFHLAARGEGDFVVQGEEVNARDAGLIAELGD